MIEKHNNQETVDAIFSEVGFTHVIKAHALLSHAGLVDRGPYFRDSGGRLEASKVLDLRLDRGGKEDVPDATLLVFPLSVDAFPFLSSERLLCSLVSLGE